MAEREFIKIYVNKPWVCPICADGNIEPDGPRSYKKQLSHAEWHGYEVRGAKLEKDPITGDKFIIASRKPISEWHK